MGSDGKEPLTLKKFKLQSIIGQGAFGKVKIIEDRETKTLYALKYMNKDEIIKQDASQHVFKERLLLHKLDHPFIVKITHCFQDDDNLFLAMQLARGGDLRFNMNSNKCFDHHTVRVYMGELSLAISYMHSKLILHRDLKPENILLDENGHILITDLNLATSIKKKKPTSQSGTLDYMAPEMLTRQPYGFSIDWWSLGTILYEIVYHKLPFGGQDKDTTIQNIKSMPLIFPDHKEDMRENDIRDDFIKGLLDRDVSNRLGGADDGRGLTKDIKPHPYFSGMDWDSLLDRNIAPTFKPTNTKYPANYSPNLLIGEMLGGSEGLSYRPRKKKKDPNQLSFGEKISGLFKKKSSVSQNGSVESLGPKPKSKSQIQHEIMDTYWTDYEYMNNDYSDSFRIPSEFAINSNPGSQPESSRVLPGPQVNSPTLGSFDGISGSKSSISNSSVSLSDIPNMFRAKNAHERADSFGRNKPSSTSPLRTPVIANFEPEQAGKTKPASSSAQLAR